jgi:hypothetical protein
MMKQLETNRDSELSGIFLEVILSPMIRECACEGNACDLTVDEKLANTRFSSREIV